MSRFLSFLDFKKGLDPIDSLGFSKKSMIINWLKKYDIDNYQINDDLTVDILGDLKLTNKNLSQFPNYLQFNIITGSCYVQNNRWRTLSGFPKVVQGDFSIHTSNIKSKFWKESYIRKHINIYGKIWN